MQPLGRVPALGAYGVMCRMPSGFCHAAIVGKYQARGIRPLLEEIAHFLMGQGLEVSFERDTAAATGVTDFEALSTAEMGQRCDLAVVVGGDGTMLGIARELSRYNLPLVGINQGRLGFITDIPIDKFKESLAPIAAGDYEEERRVMLEGGVWRDGECIFEGLSLNDVVVSRGATASMVELRVDVDDEFVANMRADGLIVATPTGSTAYALSAGGPILDPQVPAFALVPVAPHALTHRPIAVADTATIAIRLERGRDAALHCDGQDHFALAEGERITVRRAPHAARFLHPEGHDYFAMLREKLHWSETPERLRSE